MKFNEFYEIINDIKIVRLLSLEKESASTLPKQIVFFHYVKTLSLLDAIQILTQKNKTNEAGIILRSSLSLFINLKWLTSDDSDKRMQRYADFEAISKKRKMDLAGVLPRNEEEKQQTKKLEDQYEIIVEKYSLNTKDWKSMAQWSGKSIRKMAIDVGLLVDYEKIYSYLSFEEHTDPSTIRNHISRPTNEENIYIAKPSDYLISLILWTAISYYFQTEEVVAEIFNVKFPKQAVNLITLANKYLNDAVGMNT